MDFEQGCKLLDNTVKGFHGKFKKMYGQISIRLDDRSYLTTGGNKPLSEIKREDYELCDSGSGNLGEIFAGSPNVNAIIFGCTEDSVKVSEQGESVAVALEDLAMITGSFLPIIEDASAGNVLEVLQSSGVCLIKGAGVLALCSNAKKAVAAVQLAQKGCEAALHGQLLGGAIPLDPDKAEALRQEFLNDYVLRNEAPLTGYMGFEEHEFGLRSALVDCGRNLIRKDLSYGSWGNLSVRLNDDEMLITPSSMDYFETTVEDIVKVNIHTLEYGDQRVPSSEAPMHARTYIDHPDAGAVIHTHSNGISVFAACEAGFKIDDEKLGDLIGDVVVADYAPAGSDALASAVSSAFDLSHACVIPHHGAVFYGPSPEVVFAVAEAVEKKARNILAFDSIDSIDDLYDD